MIYFFKRLHHTPLLPLVISESSGPFSSFLCKVNSKCRALDFNYKYNKKSVWCIGTHPSPITDWPYQTVVCMSFKYHLIVLLKINQE